MADRAEGAFAMSGGRHHHSHQLARWRAAWSALPGVGRLALALAVLAVLVLTVSLGGLLSVLLTPSVGVASSAAMDEKQLAEKFATGFERSLAQVNGRSMFFDPGAPRREPVKIASDESDKPAAAPTRYGGPALIGFANGAAWFADGKKLGEGEGGDSKFKVKKVSAPWSATVEWEGVEFVVSLFDRDKLVLPKAAAEGAKASEVVPGATESASEDIKKDEKNDGVTEAAGPSAEKKDTVGTVVPDLKPAAAPDAPAASPKKR